MLRTDAHGLGANFAIYKQRILFRNLIKVVNFFKCGISGKQMNRKIQ